MKDIALHIAKLDLLMKSKGFDGSFLSASGYPGKLTESLAAFCRSYVNGGEYGITFPPSLTTYSYWGGEQRESVQCEFKLDYQETSGFKVKTVELESRDRYGFTDKKTMIAVISEADIPTRQQANAWRFEPEIRIPIKKSKALKF